MCALQVQLTQQAGIQVSEQFGAVKYCICLSVRPSIPYVQRRQIAVMAFLCSSLHCVYFIQKIKISCWKQAQQRLVSCLVEGPVIATDQTLKCIAFKLHGRGCIRKKMAFWAAGCKLLSNHLHIAPSCYLLIWKGWSACGSVPLPSLQKVEKDTCLRPRTAAVSLT